MTNSDLVETYLHLQDGIIADKLFTTPKAMITFCQADESPYWNFAFIKKVLSEQEIDKLEQIFIKLGRLPSIYFENKQSFYPFQELLKKKDYLISFQESWMCYEQKSLAIPTDYKVKGVTNKHELALFLELFRQCYYNPNVYGDIGEGYIKRLREAWEKHNLSQRVEYFLFYKENMPVAISTLINYKNAGYISNVGSIPQVRGQGFGKLATLHCVKKSQEKHHIYHFLATETGGFLQEFYQRIGFTIRLTAINYTKKEN